METKKATEEWKSQWTSHLWATSMANSSQEYAKTPAVCDVYTMLIAESDTPHGYTPLVFEDRLTFGVLESIGCLLQPGCLPPCYVPSCPTILTVLVRLNPARRCTQFTVYPRLPWYNMVVIYYFIPTGFHIHSLLLERLHAVLCFYAHQPCQHFI